MKELKEYYSSRKNILQSLCILSWLILEVIIILIKDSFMLGSFYISLKDRIMNIITISSENKDIIRYIINILFDFIAPTSIIYILYSKLLSYINTQGWKRKFPQYDISGEWYDNTKYTQMLDEHGWQKTSGDIVPSPVIIEQTCNSVSVKASVGKDFTWYSLLSDWNEKNALEIFYKVEYKDSLQEKGYPEYRMGYECMNICTQGNSNIERPNKMEGKFWHCICCDGKPMYMGDVTYERKTY